MTGTHGFIRSGTIFLFRSGPLPQNIVTFTWFIRDYIVFARHAVGGESDDETSGHHNRRPITEVYARRTALGVLYPCAAPFVVKPNWLNLAG